MINIDTKAKWIEECNKYIEHKACGLTAKLDNRVCGVCRYLDYPSATLLFVTAVELTGDSELKWDNSLSDVDNVKSALAKVKRLKD